MRVPRSKLYRAFPELDIYTDRQCQLLMRRVRLHPSAHVTIGLSAVGAVVVGFVLGGVLLSLTAGMGLGSAMSQHLFRDADLLWGIVMVLLPPVVLAGLTRDLLLRRYLLRAIRLRIDRVRCPACRYILIGQVERDGAVCCPECGAATALAALGITAQDLIPPSSREAELESLATGGV